MEWLSLARHYMIKGRVCLLRGKRRILLLGEMPDFFSLIYLCAHTCVFSLLIKILNVWRKCSGNTYSIFACQKIKESVVNPQRDLGEWHVRRGAVQFALGRMLIPTLTLLCRSSRPFPSNMHLGTCSANFTGLIFLDAPKRINVDRLMNVC